MLGKQRQQDSSRNTVRSSQWDSGEELKCVETTCTWREGRMKSQRKPQGTSCQELYWHLANISFLGEWLLHRKHHGNKAKLFKTQHKDYRKSIDHNNNEEKYDNIKNELMVYLFHLTNLFADVVVYRWFLLLRFESGINGKNSKDIVINSAPEIER